MGEKSNTILQSVADAVVCTLTDSSESNLNNGNAMPASTKLVRKFLTLRERERVHWHAAARTPTFLCSSDWTMSGRSLASMTFEMNVYACVCAHHRR